MDVQDEIRSWLLGQQEWFQEAADRLTCSPLINTRRC